MVTEDEIRKDYVSSRETSKMLDVNESRVIQILRADRLPGAFKFADTWLIPRVAVENYTRQKPGKKRGAVRHE